MFTTNMTRRALSVVASLIVCAATLDATPALAQRGKIPEVEKVEKSYTLPYFFSGIAVLMIIIPLCLPVLRLWEVPKEEDD